jgi:phosphatidylinositol 4-phosphatase
MDCLDRTNVVQGVFSRYIGHEQLQQMNLIPKPVNTRSQRSPFEKFPEQLEKVFREGWTDNADVMSYLYTGTPALKTDFTRTGKRTYRGAMNDGINSVTRYFINNFTDGYYHDCLDFSTLQLTATSKLKERKTLSPLKISIFAIIIITSIAKYLVEMHVLP